MHYYKEKWKISIIINKLLLAYSHLSSNSQRSWLPINIVEELCDEYGVHRSYMSQLFTHFLKVGNIWSNIDTDGGHPEKMTLRKWQILEDFASSK